MLDIWVADGMGIIRVEENGSQLADGAANKGRAVPKGRYLIP